VASNNTNRKRSKVRIWYERAFIPLGKFFGKLGISPNMVTVLSIFVGCVMVFYLWQRNLIAGLITFGIAAFLDILDGSIARAMKKTSKFGMLLDHVSDRCVEFLLILGFILGAFLPGWLGALTYFSMILPSYIRARGEAVSGISGESVGFFERKEKLGILLMGMIGEIFTKYRIIPIAALIVTVFSLITALQRIIFFHKELANREN